SAAVVVVVVVNLHQSHSPNRAMAAFRLHTLHSLPRSHASALWRGNFASMCRSAASAMSRSKSASLGGNTRKPASDLRRHSWIFFRGVMASFDLIVDRLRSTEAISGAVSGAVAPSSAVTGTPAVAGAGAVADAYADGAPAVAAAATSAGASAKTGAVSISGSGAPAGAPEVIRAHR